MTDAGGTGPGSTSDSASGSAAGGGPGGEERPSRRLAAAPSTGPARLLTCRACAVDVSVAEGAAPACPRCGGALERPHDPEGDAPEATLLEVRGPAAAPGPAPAAASGPVPAAAPGPASAPPPAAAPGPGAGRLPDGSALLPAGAWSDLRPPPGVAAARAPAAAAPGGGFVPLSDSLFETATQRGGPDGRPLGAPPAGAAPVKRLGPYELRRVLGKGGMGIVYEAWHPALGRAVALKVMSTADAGEEELERFAREARAAAKLTHPHIVPIHEVGVLEGRSYFTMELVRGRTLQELARSRSLAPLDAARLVAQVAHAIQFAHERGIIHRDLKPSNVLVDEQGAARVMDFGLAKDLTDASGLTLSGVAMGSPPYMPPEQARGEFRKVDAVSDVYGLGAILYECLTGGPPFQGKSVYDIIAKVLVEEPAPPRSKNDAVPYDLETICLKALEKEKWRRYPAAKDLAGDLERLVAGKTIRAVRQGLTTRLGRGLERHRTQIFAVLLPMAVVAALASFLLGGHPPATSRGGPTPAVGPDPGPIARAGLKLEGDENPLPTLVELASASGPTYADLRAALTLLPPAAAGTRDRIRRAFLEEGEDQASIPPERLAAATAELVRERAVDDATLGVTVHAWFDRPAGTPLAELARRAALALRGAESRDPATYALALRGPPTALDPAIVVHAARALPGDPSPAGRAAALAAVTSNAALVRRAALHVALTRSRATGDVTRTQDPDPAAPAAVTSWVFPPVRAGLGPGDDPRPVARGLAPRGAPWPPTQALLTPDGGRVVVAWLRFLWVLDEPTGRVLRRVRLPGPALGLAHRLGGGFLVATWDARGERHLEVDDAGGGLVDRATRRPVAALDLLPGPEDPVAPDELRRLAVAALPELDDEVAVVLEGEDGALTAGRPLRVERPPSATLDLGFDQPGLDRPGVLALARPGAPGRAAAVRVRPGGPAAKGALPLRDGDVLLAARLPDEGTRYARFDVLRGGALARAAFVPAAVPLDWVDLARRAGAELGDADPNPWAVAFAGLAAFHVAADDAARAQARRRVRDAAASAHLTPWERVVLGCALDRHLLWSEADLAFTRALADLTRDHAYAPELAGYGSLDAGRALARRAEHARLRDGVDAGRADALATWRNAFAPVLAESPAARAVYARLGRPAPAGTADVRSPRKGVARLELIDVLRVDHAVRFQAVLVVFVAGFLAALAVRYARHGRRDLERIGVHTPAARLALWWRRPWTRLTFAWPSYVTTTDKLAFVALYGLLFVAFAVQDAGFDAIAAVQRRHAALLSGLPGAPDGVAALAARAAGDEADPDAAYALVWALVARGAALDPEWAGPVGRARAALAGRGAARDALLLAELALAGGDAAGARAALGPVRDDPLWQDEAALLLARADGRRGDGRAGDAPAGDAAAGAADLVRADVAAAERVAARSVRQGVAWRFTGGLARPLAPPPDVAARDRLVTGTSRWWSTVPRRVLDDVTGPLVGDDNLALLSFEDAFEMNLDVARLRNRFFWLVPGSLVVLLASLFVRTPAPFEPLAIDRAPSRAVRLASLLVPGLAQVMLGRSVRGLLLLAPFVHLAQKVLTALTNVQVLALREFAAGTDGPSLQALAELTAENVSAIAEVRARHTDELAVALVLLYAVAWVDLARLRRNLRAPTDDASRAAASGGRGRDPAPLVIPVDSLADGGAAPAPPAGGPATPDAPAGDGPFDATATGSGGR